MQVFFEAIVQAIRLPFEGSHGLLSVILTTFEVALLATLIGFILGTPVGLLIGASRFRGRGLLITLTNTGMAVPPVVIGLVVMMLLSRRGPLGPLELLYTVDAMVIAQVIISSPIIAGLTSSAVAAVPYRLRLQARSLGASWFQEALLILKEARLGVLAAVATGLGAVVRGVGAVLIVGGNIEGQTRVLTTAIVQESRRGEFGLAIALSLLLLAIVFAINAAITWFQHSGEKAGRG